MSADLPNTPSDSPAESPASPKFTDLALSAPLLRALADVGYESPSPIQAATIPPLLEGRDVLGQAQTGTGKTAAFALPILAQIDPKQFKPQALVLAPTRELAIQVAEAFQKYAVHLPGFHVLPIYGGQSYYPQLQALKRGVHVVVGTPGRVIDHLDRGTLDLSELRCLVLDEADEMLRMGFIDDVENVLKKTPETRQVALFSATMPSQIKRIAQTYLKSPVEIAIKSTTTTAANIRQRYWSVSGVHKLDALTRILEAESFDAMIVFSRTKLGTEELAEKLSARGISAAAINGDVQQAQREKTIQNLKDGKIDVLVATDVAARGLDVDRISHVLNYDIPYDTESYVHRIGRTGRAGRKGEAILFVTPRERGMLRAIERATRQPIEPMELPSVETVNEQRVSRFLGRISDALESSDLGLFRDMVERYERERNVPAVEIAAALAKLVQGDNPLLLTPPPAVPRYAREERDNPREHRGQATRKFVERDNASNSGAHRQEYRQDSRPDSRRAEAPRPPRDHERSAPAPRHEERQYTPPAAHRPVVNNAESFFDDEAPSPRAERSERSHDRGAPREAEVGMETFRIEVGHSHGVQPGNIVGAIANEADLESRYIGRIDIRDDYTLVDLPEGMPRELMEHLKKVRVSGHPLRIQRATPGDTEGGRSPRPGGGPGRGPGGPGGPRPGGPRPHSGAPRPGGPRPPHGGPKKSFKPRTPR
ncbi:MULTISPECIES: DEAD/DEAH box helicase [Lysobacter]|jgi:ATP-dependent RNA helicase DeaD|uniref:ATP-dependent RNA helicase DeaD n=2 Tax=Lysobacter gummosus TaxID=262324 RepID=A0ABY3X575_9GAMM|nr:MULTISPECIES: DEAD/DEAH box helicase [Lysobacter]ALN92086.1 helicase conserved C-terminal domain protein [Lysobacter gummosus]UJB20956.1 DEAD/DEAH box helicase [Lysobacter capsici]UJQ29929.1 DEAD/DEAH box helicase [Lysobacter gummosus]UNP27721.1 DEAD/DEAH box helicase [Lysobacter gummosus]